MVTPRYENIVGGGERSCKLLVEALRTLGVNVTVLSGDILFPHIKNKELLNTVMYRYLKKITNEYDIFHTYNMSLLPAIGRLTKIKGINSVGTLNGHVYSPTFTLDLSDHPKREYPVVLSIFKRYISHIKKFTALSECEKSIWIKDGIPEEKIRVIPNMIAKNYTSETYHGDTVNILVVGNYAKWRDLSMLLKTYAELPKQDIILRVVGQGWENIIKNYKGKNILVYFPQVAHQELKDMYSKADIYVQSNEYFGIGRAMLEAAQNKTAIVTTGRLQDFPFLHGYINYFANSDMLQLTLQTLIVNKELRKLQGGDVCRIVNKYFAPENIASKYIELYKEVLDAK
jgi:glycosyltransferase involved in cell wall biosynthesis